jgi:hypothetical protein
MFRVVSSLQGFRPKYCMHLSSFPCLLHSSSIIFSTTTGITGLVFVLHTEVKLIYKYTWHVIKLLQINYLRNSNQEFNTFPRNKHNDTDILMYGFTVFGSEIKIANLRC